MQLIDYTHPEKVPKLYLPMDRRSPAYYLRLDELPPGHPYHATSWALFRYPEWLEGGSAWVQAKAIAADFEKCVAEHNLSVETAKPVIGSEDPAFDEALAQALMIFGLKPLIAEPIQRK